MLPIPAKDSRLKWVRTHPHVEQLAAADGGTVGTVCYLPKAQIFSASTHRRYLGGFSSLQEARNAVEDRFAEEQEERNAARDAGL